MSSSSGGGNIGSNVGGGNSSGSSSGGGGSGGAVGSGSGSKRKEIYKYVAPWPLYSMNWSVRPDKRFRLALGSFVEEYNNKVQIISLDEDTGEFSAKSTFDHPYPTTKVRNFSITILIIIIERLLNCY